MIRIHLGSSALAGLLLVTLSAGAFAQGARARGDARAEGRAVPRGSAGGTTLGAAPAPPPPPSAAPGGVPQPSGMPASGVRVAPPMLGVQPMRQPPVAPLPGGNVGTIAPLQRQNPRVVGPAVPRSVPRVVTPQPQVSRPGVVLVQPRIIQPGSRYYSPYYQPYYRDIRPIYRPYYSFRPRVHLGFGLWVGFPVTYPSYFYPYSYPYPSPNAYPYATSVYVVPQTNYVVPGTTTSIGAAGGLSFEITPGDAELFVDGQFYGLVDYFTPNRPPLALAPGRHHVEIRASGFEIIAFDVDILPGQVIPYRGELQRY
jgi:hypothetical protein